ncbi:MAG: hypothetical protein LPK45_08155, partial [Bacteroidota bacterium]|nr:hypothetical protein [Bacteroidota bacterium]MDX5431040.1 hypothetical protein [Bacteroidota bacterium]MDX5469794.1 hypothetical protein [Bacteroidota bacterium]
MWAGFIMSIMFMPASGIDSPKIASFDKLIHLCVFAMLCYLTITGLVKQYRFSIRKMVAAR